MPLIQAIVLGIIQGLTEFLPISSTAHLVIIPKLFGWAEHSLSFDIALHVGTLAAVILYFFRDWIQVIGQGFGLRVGMDPELGKNRGLLWLLVAATIPIGIIGYLFKARAEAARENLYLIATMMIVVGLIMLWADRSGRKQKDLSHLSTPDALLIGIAQAIAVIPGVSRSGITITAGLFRNLEREAAARFSFLLLVPAIAGAAAKDFWDLMKHGGGIPADERTAFLVGILVSAVTGGIVIGFFLDFLRRRSLTFFVFYRVVFGIIVFALATFLPH